MSDSIFQYNECSQCAEKDREIAKAHNEIIPDLRFTIKELQSQLQIAREALQQYAQSYFFAHIAQKALEQIEQPFPGTRGKTEMAGNKTRMNQ